MDQRNELPCFFKLVLLVREYSVVNDLNGVLPKWYLPF